MTNKTFSDLNKLFKQNNFRDIDKDINCERFYLLKSISKSATLKEFCNEYNLKVNLDEILADSTVTTNKIKTFIKNHFKAKDNEEMLSIESELNKMEYFDWGGSFGNSLEKNIINNYVKKNYSYEKIKYEINHGILSSVNGYTLNSWYNHWSTILIEEIFNQNSNITPTIDLIKNIDFFIDGVPFDLKVTYFPEELMESEIKAELKHHFGVKNLLPCLKKIAKDLAIAIPNNENDKKLVELLYTLIIERNDITANSKLKKIEEIKTNVYKKYVSEPNKLIKWLYENQGESRFDASNRFYLVLIDKENNFNSWRLKRKTYTMLYVSFI